MEWQLCTIIGAGEGLGRSLAIKFAAEGYDLALVSRTKAGTAAARDAALAAGTGIEVKCFEADATQPHTIENAINNIHREVGPTSVLIYNVRGTFTACEPAEMSYPDLEDVLRIEVIGAFAAAKSVLPSMRQRGNGSIFFSSATAAFRGSATYPLYAIGKFGLRGLSQSLAKAYAKDGVHIVHVRLDCDLDVPVMRELYGDQYDSENLADPDAVALSYWLAHQQPRSAWSNEIEIRPHREKWTY